MHTLTQIGLLAATLALATMAYRLGSKLALALALTSLAALVSADLTLSFFFPFSRTHLQGTGWRFLGCAALLIAWRAGQIRFLPHRRDLIGMLEGFAVHLGGVGAVLLTLPGYFDRPLPTSLLGIGMAVLCAFVLLVGGVGWRRGQRSLVIAAIVYAFVGIGRLEVQLVDTTLLLAAGLLVTLVAAALSIRQVRRGFTNRR